MEVNLQDQTASKPIQFYGGLWGALLPFGLFLAGVISIALSGAPDERGFWPVLLAALACGLLLAKDKQQFSETVIKGMSQEIVMVMIMAWMLASIIGVLMTLTGFVEALTWLGAQVAVNGSMAVLITFVICCLVSLSTGSSFATILICGPILYPAGGMMGAHLPSLAGAIIGGATFGDFIAPISDTTIASALSQQAKIGPTVKSRIKYMVPVLIFALIAFALSAGLGTATAQGSEGLTGNPKGLPMLLVPLFIIFLFLRGKHLLHGLLLGLVAGMSLGLILGLLPLADVFSLDLDNFTAKSFVIDGINRAVGISFFTILLMGLVAALKASGLVATLVAFANARTHNVLQSEGWMAGVVSAAVLLTTHSVVAVLMVSEFVQTTGKRMDIAAVRRANILSMAVCVFPFLFPYFIPVILVANTTQSGSEFGVEAVAPLEAGMYNFVAWGLLAMLVLSLLTGYGRKQDQLMESNN